MGYASRLNHRSFDRAASRREVLNSRLARFFLAFPDRAAYERYLSGVKGMNDQWRAELERLLPEHLKVQSV